MISRKDLVLKKHTSGTNELLASLSARRLISLVKHWFNVPELRPTHKSAQFAIYEGFLKKKSSVIERILSIDWPRGLYSIQIAQLETYSLISKESEKSWQVGRILTANGKLRLDLNAASIKESIEDFISKHLSCYLYILHHKESDLYWMRIEIYPKTENTSLSTHDVTFIVFYPQTEFIIVSNRRTSTKNMRTYIKEAILKAYGGDKIDFQPYRGKIISQITSIIRTRKSQGVFAQLRHNQVDSNPLDIRQKAPVRLEHEQGPVNKSDLDRRIKPIDLDEINLRKKLALGDFGHGYTSSATSLKVNAALPFNTGNQNENESLPIIKFELIMQGSDIAKGVRNMIQKGRIDVNPPKWLATIGSTGATHLYITKEGASQIEAEDSDMEEVSESDDISQMGDGEQDQADDEEQD